MSEGKTPPPATGELTARMDRALADWPSAKRATLEWDDAAEQVMSYIGSGQQPRTADQVSDEDLLRPALPMSPEEVQSSAAVATGSEASNMSNVSSRERDRASLKDLAKLAGAPSSRTPASGVLFGAPPSPKAEVEPGEAKKENSGMINLAALAAEEAAATSAKVPSLSAEAMSTMRSAEAVKATPAPVKSDKKAIPWVAVSGLVAAAAVAAGVFFGMQRAQRSEPQAAVAVATPPAAAPVVAANPAQPQPAATPIPPADQGVDPSTLPAAGQTGQTVASIPGRTTVAPGPARAPGAPVASAAVAPALVAVIPTAATPAPTSSDQNLQSMMQQAAGSSPTATPAAAPTTADTSLPAPGSVPLKPSQGAIQGALGAALPGARACLGADDPISHVTVTFKSDGSVQSVAVSGGAAGKPAEACIRSALSKARVTPFAQPTFTASTTVRPN
jgi:hypothetical protein